MLSRSLDRWLSHCHTNPKIFVAVVPLALLPRWQRHSELVTQTNTIETEPHTHELSVSHTSTAHCVERPQPRIYGFSPHEPREDFLVAPPDLIWSIWSKCNAVWNTYATDTVRVDTCYNIESFNHVFDSVVHMISRMRIPNDRHWNPCSQACAPVIVDIWQKLRPFDHSHTARPCYETRRRVCVWLTAVMVSQSWGWRCCDFVVVSACGRLRRVWMAWTWWLGLPLQSAHDEFKWNLIHYMKCKFTIRSTVFYGSVKGSRFLIDMIWQMWLIAKVQRWKWFRLDLYVFIFPMLGGQYWC